jgi:hypothetical protein
MKRILLVGLGMSLAFVGLARAGGGDDDLAVVKRALTVEPSAQEQGGSRNPKWLRVRIEEKGKPHSKVSVNLPLGIVRALDDDISFGWHCHRTAGEKCKIKLSEILKSLEAGQQIVEIDSEEETVKVWID